MAITIKNEFLRVRIKEKGAELGSLFAHATGLEYIWNADPAFWGKSSPVLFPIVGQLKSDTYIFEDKSYSLPRHGFARDMVFEVEETGADYAVFQLRSNESTRLWYPFDFDLRIRYTLDGNRLMVGYSVRNETPGAMYFSLGAHPAFAVPLVPGTKYDDYFLAFSHEETAPRWKITSSGQISDPESFLDSSNVLPLTKELFAHDALVFKGLQSETISIKSSRHNHGLDFSFAGWPYFGIWAAPGADFVCLEPWCGIADSVDHNQLLTEKDGIQTLLPGSTWTREWSVTCF
jgi:galactose mutarotase-like enzyme